MTNLSKIIVSNGNVKHSKISITTSLGKLEPSCHLQKILHQLGISRCAGVRCGSSIIPNSNKKNTPQIPKISIKTVIRRHLCQITGIKVNDCYLT